MGFSMEQDQMLCRASKIKRSPLRLVGKEGAIKAEEINNGALLLALPTATTSSAGSAVGSSLGSPSPSPTITPDNSPRDHPNSAKSGIENIVNDLRRGAASRLTAKDKAHLAKLTTSNNQKMFVLVSLENWAACLAANLCSSFSAHKPKIVHASKCLCDFTGFLRHEIEGQDPEYVASMLCDDALLRQPMSGLDRLRAAVCLGSDARPIRSSLLCFKKDRTPFLCIVVLTPMFTVSHTLAYIAVEAHHASELSDADIKLAKSIKPKFHDSSAFHLLATTGSDTNKKNSATTATTKNTATKSQTEFSVNSQNLGFRLTYHVRMQSNPHIATLLEQFVKEHTPQQPQPLPPMTFQFLKSNSNSDVHTKIRHPTFIDSAQVPSNSNSTSDLQAPSSLSRKPSLKFKVRKMVGSVLSGITINKSSKRNSTSSASAVVANSAVCETPGSLYLRRTKTLSDSELLKRRLQTHTMPEMMTRQVEFTKFVSSGVTLSECPSSPARHSLRLESCASSNSVGNIIANCDEAESSSNCPAATRQPSSLRDIMVSIAEQEPLPSDTVGYNFKQRKSVSLHALGRRRTVATSDALGDSQQ
eukprot:c9387_g1_i1.p1 GENE.c9387_g1_i1~~c9387_g1_i1.p1  ORF type:complete len:587 (+),score=104.43 c9387_g1_i1:1-1761(+)